MKTSRDKSSQLSEKIFELNKENSVLKSKIAHRDESAKEEARVLNSIL